MGAQAASLHERVSANSASNTSQLSVMKVHYICSANVQARLPALPCKQVGQIVSIQFGAPGDVIVPADYDNDNCDDSAVFRSGVRYVRRSTNGQTTNISWGAAGDVPVPANYDGDGQDDYAVFRNGTWYILRSRDGYISAVWGIAGDLPIPAAHLR